MILEKETNFEAYLKRDKTKPGLCSCTLRQHFVESNISVGREIQPCYLLSHRVMGC